MASATVVEEAYCRCCGDPLDLSVVVSAGPGGDIDPSEVPVGDDSCVVLRGFRRGYDGGADPDIPVVAMEVRVHEADDPETARALREYAGRPAGGARA